MKSDMSDRQDYFKTALSNFTFDVASGGAIRHLTDRGYTADQIRKMLDVPTPFGRIQDTIWKHLLDKEVILLEEPGSGGKREKYDFIAEYDSWGRRSYRRVVVEEKVQEPVRWQEKVFAGTGREELWGLLREKTGENGEGFSYISCDFGLHSRRDPKQYAQRLEQLEEPLRNYILGIPWERKLSYHRLDERMRQIAVSLYESGGYKGSCYFVKTGEKVILGS